MIGSFLSTSTITIVTGAVTMETGINMITKL